MAGVRWRRLTRITALGQISDSIDTGPDIALDLVESRAFPKGITIQVYRPAGRPQYATATTD